MDFDRAYDADFAVAILTGVAGAQTLRRAYLGGMSEKEPTPPEASRGAKMFGAVASIKAAREAGAQAQPAGAS
jgi:hypothetical protein